MAIFDHIRALITGAPEGTKPVVICVPHANSGKTMNFATPEAISFHDELGILESRGGPNSLFFHAADLQRIFVLYATKSVGEHLEADHPDLWAMVGDKGRLDLKKLFV